METFCPSPFRFIRNWFYCSFFGLQFIPFGSPEGAQIPAFTFAVTLLLKDYLMVMWAELSNFTLFSSWRGHWYVFCIHLFFYFTCWRSRAVNWEQLAEGLEEKFESELGKMSKKRVWISKEKISTPRKIICVPISERTETGTGWR